MNQNKIMPGGTNTRGRVDSIPESKPKEKQSCAEWIKSWLFGTSTSTNHVQNSSGDLESQLASSSDTMGHLNNSTRVQYSQYNNNQSFFHNRSHNNHPNNIISRTGNVMLEFNQGSRSHAIPSNQKNNFRMPNNHRLDPQSRIPNKGNSSHLIIPELSDDNYFQGYFMPEKSPGQKKSVLTQPNASNNYHSPNFDKRQSRRNMMGPAGGRLGMEGDDADIHRIQYLNKQSGDINNIRGWDKTNSSPRRTLDDRKINLGSMQNTNSNRQTGVPLQRNNKNARACYDTENINNIQGFSSDSPGSPQLHQPWQSQGRGGGGGQVRSGGILGNDSKPTQSNELIDKGIEEGLKNFLNIKKTDYLYEVKDVVSAFNDLSEDDISRLVFIESMQRYILDLGIFIKPDYDITAPEGILAKVASVVFNINPVSDFTKVIDNEKICKKYARAKWMYTLKGLFTIALLGKENIEQKLKNLPDKKFEFDMFDKRRRTFTWRKEYTTQIKDLLDHLNALALFCKEIKDINNIKLDKDEDEKVKGILRNIANSITKCCNDWVNAERSVLLDAIKEKFEQFESCTSYVPSSVTEPIKKGMSFLVKASLYVVGVGAVVYGIKAKLDSTNTDPSNPKAPNYPDLNSCSLNSTYVVGDECYNVEAFVNNQLYDIFDYDEECKWSLPKRNIICAFYEKIYNLAVTDCQKIGGC